MMLVAEIQRATLIEMMWLNMVVENSKLMSFSGDELYKSYRYRYASTPAPPVGMDLAVGQLHF